ncbi:MAG TPA: glycosyltransferase family 10, partial [Desulfobacterales bacterium]|nr:glycosyltransferase family 10 [Desulfobacterales bacterium]
MQQEIKVKLVNRSSLADEESVYRIQSPGNAAKWGSCSFTFNPLEKNYDWLVVIDDIPKITPNGVEILSCPKENTILVTTEPSSITRYGRAFAKQFHYLITNQDEKVLPHPNAIRSQTGNNWFYGKDYDSIVSVTHPTKTKKISTVCSNKQQGHTIHRLRYEFTKIMEERIPELERFGRGFKWIETKAEALDDYEFHVAIENQYAPHVWTEKLADAFLGFTVPIYFGCPNVYDYFPKESLIQIDMYDIEGSIAKIKEI